MLFIFGWGRQTRREFGPCLPMRCPSCGNNAYWNLSRIRTWFTLFFIPVIPYESEHWLLCEVCSRGLRLTGDQIDRALALNEATLAFKNETIAADEYRKKMATHLFDHPLVQSVILPQISPKALPASSPPTVPDSGRLELMIRAAKQGDCETQFDLAGIYERGEGVEKDIGEAIRWYRLAAEQGHTGAQNDLGVLYFRGENVQQDFQEAFKWYSRAAKAGLPVAQSNLGYLYQHGLGVDRDPEQAAELYKAAADTGHARAQTLLGSLYWTGVGVPLDYGAAFNLFLRAADQEWP